MITRMITSSKKVAGPRHLHMSVDVADGLPMDLQDDHPPTPSRWTISNPLYSRVDGFNK